MKSIPQVGLRDVQAVYSGAEGDLWELVMGQQVHIGGLQSSMDLAAKAGVQPGSHGIDLCCCTGAGMRFLVRFCKVATMHGVDATTKVVERGRERCRAEGLDKQITFTVADVCASGLPSAGADFVWGEDAWCYVVDKPKLIAEAARLVKPGGVVAFTDWLEGPANLSMQEAERFLTFMKFPNILDLGGYKDLLRGAGCEVQLAEDTGRFAEYTALYLAMLQKQLTYDALRIIGFDNKLMQAMGEELEFIRQLAAAGKVIQGLIVARKRE